MRLVSVGWVEGAALLASGGSASCESAEHLVDGRPADHGLGGFGEAFVVAGESAVGG